jgi:DNA invertase Pin-like site-specific DNA recombinase
MRLVPYIRVSAITGRDPTVETSAPDQRRAIEAYAVARCLELGEWVEDFDQPGTRYERPGFQRALEMVEGGEAGGVIVAKLNRFARSVVDGRRALQRLREAEGSLVIVEESLDTTTAVGRAMFSILLAFAELEVEQIRENWAVQRADAVARGVQVGRAPTGYRRREDGTLEVDPLAGPVIRELFLRRGAGASWAQLANFLDEQLPKPNNGAWNPQTISKLVQTRTYLGEVRNGAMSKAAAHEALVSRAEWEAAQGERVGARSRSGSLLAGLVRCGPCGHVLVRGRSNRFPTYRCRGRHLDGRCPAPVAVGLARADTLVTEAFLRWGREQRLRLEGVDRRSGVARALAEVEAAEAELAEYRDANLISVIGRDAFVAGLSERARTIDAARSRLVDSQLASPLAVELDLDELWRRSDLAARRTLLASAIDSVTVKRAHSRGQGTPIADRLAIVWREDVHDPPTASRVEGATSN